jgi:hypothetical protein
MPNRIIRDSARFSGTLDALSAEGERMFWRLTTVADDFGRFRADPRVLLANCFPLRVDTWKSEKVAKWLQELVNVDAVSVYEVSGKRYGFFKTWDRHQQRRAAKSKFPDPPLRADASTCMQGHADSLGIGIGIGNGNGDGDGNESRPRRSRKEDSPVPTTDPPWPSPLALIRLYNDTVPPGHPTVQQPSQARLEKARRYLKQFPERSFWERVFGEIERSQFLRGKRPKPGHERFRADFDWLLTKGKDGTENAVKVFEGKYRDDEECSGSEKHEPGFLNLR